MTEKITRVVIPATPGFKCVQPLHSGADRQPVDIEAVDVIAWLVEYITDKNGELISQYALPITPDVVRADDPYAIQTPSGEYIFQCDTTFRAGKQAKRYVLEHFREWARIEKEIKERKEAQPEAT